MRSVEILDIVTGILGIETENSMTIVDGRRL
jgi:hypothetical protein